MKRTGNAVSSINKGATRQSAGGPGLKPKGGRKKGSGPTPGSWKKGQSGNPKGFVRMGTSLAEIIRGLQELSPAQVRQALRAAGSDGKSLIEKRLARLVQNVALKTLRHLNTLASVCCDPNPSPALNEYLSNRDEGKVPDPVKHSGEVTLRVVYEK